MSVPARWAVQDLHGIGLRLLLAGCPLLKYLFSVLAIPCSADRDVNGGCDGPRKPLHFWTRRRLNARQNGNGCEKDWAWGVCFCDTPLFSHNTTARHSSELRPCVLPSINFNGFHTPGYSDPTVAKLTLDLSHVRNGSAPTQRELGSCGSVSDPGNDYTIMMTGGQLIASHSDRPGTTRSICLR
ncbi:hypothetical protein BCR44DRAFT_1043188 [Catenaria anguillulae PL171]|uniref:Uncharacterized protein n=1 Tax=Catenaria anguillulae PL171 TaxID=765915 RepID=A0A1Y2HVW6_9FUNG|nr:hypothetical protein BCR44DRAFT_1043188 [Catenaria anguillulae PL171]